MAARVLHERVRRVEAHRLGVEQRGAERGRVPALQPRRRVDEVGEAHRVALGEAVAGEGGQLLPDDLDDVGADAALGRPVGEALVEPLHPLVAALRAHGLPEHVGLAGAEAAHVDGHLHELLLEQRHAERLLQRRLQQRVEVGDLLQPVATADVRVHRPALDRPGPDERHLHDEVVELPRSQPRERGHLGPALHHLVLLAQAVHELGAEDVDLAVEDPPPVGHLLLFIRELLDEVLELLVGEGPQVGECVHRGRVLSSRDVRDHSNVKLSLSLAASGSCASLPERTGRSTRAPVRGPRRGKSPPTWPAPPCRRTGLP